MTGQQRTRTARLAIAALLGILFAVAAPAEASNMAFKINKGVCQQGTAPLGQNLVGLPYNSPYLGSGGPERVCQACGLTNAAQVTMWDGQGNISAHLCGTVPQFELIPGRGMMIQEPGGNKNCILVGSDQPGKTVTFHDLGTSPVGTNVVSVDYHTMAVTPEDFCVDCGLSNTAIINRFDACNGQILSHQCGQVAQWNLVLGEAILVLEDQGPRTCTPSHF